MSLSKLRAASVRDYLISKGVDASKIITTGKGETKPIASNETKEGRAKNRRVEIQVLGRVGGEWSISRRYRIRLTTAPLTRQCRESELWFAMAHKWGRSVSEVNTHCY